MFAACSAFAGPLQQDDSISVSQFLQMVRYCGLESRAVDKTGTRYDIHCNGSRIYARLDAANGKFNFARFSVGYKVGKYIPYSELQEWSQYGPSGLRAGSSIDGTVFLVGWFTPYGLYDLKDELEMLARWDKLMKTGPLRRCHLEPIRMFEYGTKPMVGNRKIYALWSRDIEYLRNLWHATPKDRSLRFWFMPGLQSMETSTPVSFSSGLFGIGAAPDPISSASKIELAVMGIPHPSSAAQNIVWATAQDMHGYVRVSKVIDLSDGITLQQLHRRLDDFGKRVASLHLDLDIMKQSSRKR
ncbi:MAG: hypothetical protein ACHQ50_14415 [Fimbriimonadales bacterium]